MTTNMPKEIKNTAGECFLRVNAVIKGDKVIHKGDILYITNANGEVTACPKGYLSKRKPILQNLNGPK